MSNSTSRKQITNSDRSRSESRDINKRELNRSRILSIVFGLFLILSYSNCSKPVEQRKIAIVPLGKVDQSMIHLVRDSLLSVYGLVVEISETSDLPDWAFVHVKNPRYRADSLLKHLKTIHPEYDHVIGLTASDISITKYQNKSKGKIKEPERKYGDFGIFGLGSRPGRACVVSYYRLFKGVSLEMGRRRLGLIAVHEIGHNLGLKHCENRTCLMTDAMESIRTIDQCSGELCESCRAQIKW